MLIPYVELNGQRTITDLQIKALWAELEKDRTAKIVFYNDAINTADDFLQFMKKPENLVIFMAEENRIMGVAWLNGLSESQAFAHFAFTKEAYGKHTENLGKEVLNYWFEMKGKDGPLFTIIMGLIPEFNKKALYYIERLGFKRVGRIPKIVNRKDAAILSYYEV